MIRPSPWCAAIGVLLVAASVAAFGQDSRRSLSAGDRETLSWIGSLDSVELAGRPYVEVFLHNDSRGPAWNWDEVIGHRGFLLEDGPDSFRVWCLDLLPRRLEHGVRAFGELSSHWVIKRLDLEAGVRSLVAVLERPRAEVKAESSQRGTSYYVVGSDAVACGEALDPGWQALVLASACLRLRREDLAARLCDASSSCTKESHIRSPGRITYLEPDEDPNALPSAAKLPAREDPAVTPAAEFSNLLRGNCVRVFGEPDFRRADILTMHRRYLELFPSDDDQGEVAARAKVIEQMIAEDKAHNALPRSQSRSLAQEVDELVFDLRNATESLAVESPRWRPDGAASRLIELGLPAVPKLIEALADDRPTRCVDADVGSFCRREGHVNRVRVYALVILEKIAGRRFTWKQGSATWAEGFQTPVREWWNALPKGREQGRDSRTVPASGTATRRGR